MRPELPLVVLGLLVVIALAVPAASAGTGTIQAGRATVKVAFNKTLKKAIVVDGKGKTLYLFTNDTAGKATCAAVDPRCPFIWPAFAKSANRSPEEGSKPRCSALRRERAV